MDKVIPVAGDVTLEGFGISPEDLKLLCDEVSIVFNSAATVRFDEDLRTAVDLNVKGPQRLMNVCHQMKRLEVATSFICVFLSHCLKSCLVCFPGSRSRFDGLQQSGQGEH